MEDNHTYTPPDYIPDDNIFMTVNVSSKICKKIDKDPLKDYTEIKPKYLKFFFGCWVKYINKQTKEYFSGGILTELNYQYKSVYLRQLSKDQQAPVIKLSPIENYKYFVRNDSENYRAYVNIVSEYQYISEKLKKISLSIN